MSYYEDNKEIVPRPDYVDTRYQKISNKECELVKNTIEKTKKLKKEYGYKNENQYIINI